MTLQIGDWVQATEEITEEGFRGPGLHVHAKRGGIGHVMSVPDDEWITVTWERTGTTTDCHVTEIKFLGDAETGRHPAKPPDLRRS